MKKRESCRAIIMTGDYLMTMHRVKKLPKGQYRSYSTFPGGGVDPGESLEDCVQREVLEEFGIVVKPIRKIYEYVDEESIQHFFLCEWVSGVFGSGEGPEMRGYHEQYGHYYPTLVKVNDIHHFELLPDEVTKQMISDIDEVGYLFKNEVTKIKGHLERSNASEDTSIYRK